MERQILHVDVNNAFLSWSAIDLLNKGYEIDIRDIPAVIGGDEERRSGIVLAKSMKAKLCGVITGEPLYQARKKCPMLKVFPGNYKFYYECSDKLYNLLLDYTDCIERFSIDECFLDMTYFLCGKTLLEKACEINRRVREELGFTVNVGVSTNKVLAKMASDFTKPDKIHTLYKEEIKTKMWRLPVRELFMLGKSTEEKLNNMGIKTIGELAKTDCNLLIKKFGKHGRIIWEYANGIDEAEVVANREKPKGISNSVTLPRDVDNKDELYSIILSLVEMVSYRLRKENLEGSVVTCRLRTNNFIDFSHQGKLSSPTSNTKDIYEKAKSLLDEMYRDKSQIRLVGVGVDTLTEKGKGQISLFDNRIDKKQERVDMVMDSLKNKYGYQMLKRASELNSTNLVKIRRSN